MKDKKFIYKSVLTKNSYVSLVIHKQDSIFLSINNSYLPMLFPDNQTFDIHVSRGKILTITCNEKDKK